MTIVLCFGLFSVHSLLARAGQPKGRATNQDSRANLHALIHEPTCTPNPFWSVSRLVSYPHYHSN